jgi:hypothetical protein
MSPDDRISDAVVAEIRRVLPEQRPCAKCGFPVAHGTALYPGGGAPVEHHMPYQCGPQPMSEAEMKARIAALEAENARLVREWDMARHKIRRFEWWLNANGYRGCDVPACNCGSWHGGHSERRVGELREALKELVATVRGECPRLLDEDRGASASLVEALMEVAGE